MLDKNPEFWIKIAPGVKAKTHKTKIISLEHESGSGHNFNLSGYCSFGSCPEKTFKFDAYFNTNTRKGWIKLRS